MRQAPPMQPGIMIPAGETPSGKITLHDAKKFVEQTLTPEEPFSDVGLRPTGNFVLIEPIEKELLSKSGLAFPQTANKKSNEGIVRAVGPGKREYRPDIAEQNVLLAQENRLDEIRNVWEHVPLDLAVGDRVLYVRWAGYSVEVDDKHYYLVEDSAVVCVATNPQSVLAFWQDHHG